MNPTNATAPNEKGGMTITIAILVGLGLLIHWHRGGRSVDTQLPAPTAPYVVNTPTELYQPTVAPVIISPSPEPALSSPAPIVTYEPPIYEPTPPKTGFDNPYNPMPGTQD